jgi:hypothetical protein
MPTIIAILILALHLLAANVAAAGPLIAAWMAGRGPEGVVASRRLVAWALAALVVSGILGAGMLLAPSDDLRMAVARFPASAWWYAGGELVFSSLCLAGLWLVLRSERRRPLLTWMLAIVSASNLLYHFPPLMAVIGRVATDAAWADEPIMTRRILVRLSLRPEIMSLWIHFVVASLAVAAVAAIALVRWPRSGAVSDEALADVECARLTRRLAGIALAASAVQLPVGGWLLAASDTRMRDALVGGDLTATGCFVAGVLATISLLQSLAALAMGDTTSSMRRRTLWLTLAVVVLMAATLSVGRAAGFASHRRAVSSQPPSAASFSGSLLAAS